MAGPAAPRVYQLKEDRYSSHSAILRLVGPGSGRRLLDVGAADGYLARRLSGQGWRVTALERDRGLAELARPHCEQVILADLDQSVPPVDGPFGAIVYGDVLEHLVSPERVFTSLNERLAPDGSVIVSMPNIAHLWVRLRLLCGRFDYQDRGIMDRTHLRFYTLRTFRQFFEACGMTLVRVVPVPVPLPLAVPDRFHGPWLDGLHAASALASRCWPRGLAYQFVGVGRRTGHGTGTGHNGS